jgi:hypothetical protein
VEIAVGCEQLRTDGKPQHDTAFIHRDDVDPEQLRERALSRRLKARRVYLPEWEEMYFATATIWAFVSTPLNAGMIAPPLVTCFSAIANDGLSWSRFGPVVPVVPATASV